ncbi:ASST-domain-containing protein [Mariannaea sp. PMI_226]|nr:ASST-domain-containing protein [Mariannaea sp. PMI_226]
MIVSTSTARVNGLFGLGTFLACFFLYYLLSDVQYPNYKPVTFESVPEFPSEPYVEIVSQKETSPDYEVMWPYRVFKSSPYNPPYFNVFYEGGELADGYLFFTPKERQKRGQKQNYPLIMGQDNELVYCHVEKSNCNNFRVQYIDGEPHLTLWFGKSVFGHGYGNVAIMDQNYQHDTLIQVQDPRFSTLRDDFEISGIIDFHESEITDRGTILVTAYTTRTFDFAGIGSSDMGFIVDSMIYEVDIKTNNITFQWSAFEKLSPTRSRQQAPSKEAQGNVKDPHDLYHINSVQSIDDDALLVSFRHLWSVMLISRNTGEIIWELNGSGEQNVGSFGALPPDAQFRWQHNARAHNWTEHGFRLSMYDNHNHKHDKNITTSRALVFDVALPPNPSVPPVLVYALTPLDEMYSECQASFDMALSNGNKLMSDGPIPLIREYGPSGDSEDIVWEGRYGYDNKAQSYRVFKSEWHGTPTTWMPRLVVEDKLDRLTGYVSWNGATDVESWNVYTVKRGVRLEPAGWAKKAGFETMIEMPPQFNNSMCFVVGAVQKGVEIAQSNMACPMNVVN